jgi:ribonucleoside-diphosphate reductase alpha chain
MESYILNMKSMPSMRALMTAGKALTRDEIAAYNCSSIAITHIRCFDELFFLALNGCGTGFSVERQYINSLPEISEDFYESDITIVVRDSKIG